MRSGWSGPGSGDAGVLFALQMGGHQDVPQLFGGAFGQVLLGEVQPERIVEAQNLFQQVRAVQYGNRGQDVIDFLDCHDECLDWYEPRRTVVTLPESCGVSAR